MLKLNFLLIILFAVLLLSSCKKNVNPFIPEENSFQYPLEVGDKWEYDRQIATFNYRSIDSLNYPRNDDSIHHYSKISVEVVRKETILDSVETSVIQSLETSSSMQSFWSEHYYRNETNGLFLYAYNMYGSGGNGLPKSSNSEKIIFKGKEFNSINDITQALGLFLPKTYNIYSDSINFNNPPLMVLAYPIVNYSEWIFKSPNEPFAINKRVLEKENIKISSRLFSCHKIEWLYDLDNNYLWDEDISVIDYISTEGLIKRTMLIKDLVITTSASPDANGYFDWSEEIILTNTNL